MHSLAFLCSDSEEERTGRVSAPSCTQTPAEFFFPQQFPETFAVEEAKPFTSSNPNYAVSASSIFDQLSELMVSIRSETILRAAGPAAEEVS